MLPPCVLDRQGVWTLGGSGAGAQTLEFSAFLPFSLRSDQRPGLPLAFSESQGRFAPGPPAISPASSQRMPGAPWGLGSWQPLKAPLTGPFSFSSGQRLHCAHQHLHPEPLPARRHLPPEREPKGRLQVPARPWALPPPVFMAARRSVAVPAGRALRVRDFQPLL